MDMQKMHFEIQGSYQEAEAQWRTNVICHVVASSAQKALDLVLQKYPGIKIHSLQHRGKVDIIEESEGAK